MTPEEKVAQLGSAWVFQLADRDGLDPDAGADLLRNGLGQVTRISGASSLACPRSRSAGQRGATPPRGRNPPRHPGDRPRGDLLRSDGARCDDLPASDRRRQHVATRVDDGTRRRSAGRDACDRRSPGTLPGARRLPRPAVGPDRRDVRRRPVPRRPHGGGLRPRAPRRRPRHRGRGDRQALRRLRRLGGRAQLGAFPHRSARAPARFTSIPSRRSSVPPASTR